MRRVIVRLVSANDDGGIKQSEVQFSRELCDMEVEVIRVVLGGTGSRYIYDVAEEIHCNVKFSGYKGYFKKLIGIVANQFKAWSIGKKIAKKIRKLSDCDSVTVTARRVTLVPLVLTMAKQLGAVPIYQPGSSVRRGFLGSIWIYYYMLTKFTDLVVIANSKYQAKSFGIKKIQFYIYPGFDPHRLSAKLGAREAVRRSLGIPDAAIILLYMARLEPSKAADRLVAAFNHYCQAVPCNSYLVIAGPCKDQKFCDRLQDMIEASDFRERIFLVGPQQDVASWYSAADIFVNSRQNAEPFGISIVEALHCGLPVLSSALGGPRETIQDGRNGWLVEDMSIDGYIDGLYRVFRDKPRWGLMAKHARESSEMFSVKNQILRYIAVIDSLHHLEKERPGQ